MFAKKIAILIGLIAITAVGTSCFKLKLPSKNRATRTSKQLTQAMLKKRIKKRVEPIAKSLGDLALTLLQAGQLHSYNQLAPAFGLPAVEKLRTGQFEAFSAMLLMRNLHKGVQPPFCSKKKRKRMDEERIVELEKLVVRLSIAFTNKKTKATSSYDGAGILYTSDGFVFTAAHLLSEKKHEVDWNKSYARDYKGKKYELRYFDEGLEKGYDLAILKIAKSGSKAPTLCLGSLKRSRRPVYSFYREADNRYIRMTGVVRRRWVSSTHVEKMGRVRKTFVVRNLGRQGHSGSAVFNSYGELIGIDSYCSNCYGKKDRLNSETSGVAHIGPIRRTAKDSYDYFKKQILSKKADLSYLK